MFVVRGRVLPAGRLEVEAGDGPAEQEVVRGEPHRRDHRHQIPLGRRALEHAEDEPVDDVAVGVADEDAEHGRRGEAQPHEDRVDDVQPRGDEEEQELQRLRDAADHAAATTPDTSRALISGRIRRLAQW